MDEANIDFGACCYCEKEDETVRNIISLEKKAPVPGTGWGCFVCDLQTDGALAVLCDECAGADREPKYAINGYATSKERIPIDDLNGDHEHNYDLHHEFDKQRTMWRAFIETTVSADESDQAQDFLESLDCETRIEIRSDECEPRDYDYDEEI